MIELVIWKKINELCERDGIDLATLAEEIGFQPGELQKWEHEVPSVAALDRVAIHFGVPFNFFVQERWNPPTEDPLSTYIKDQVVAKKVISVLRENVTSLTHARTILKLVADEIERDAKI